MTYYHGGTDWQEGGSEGPEPHLTECPCTDKAAHPDGCLCCEVASPCICDRLRACELRVIDKALAVVLELTRKPGAHGEHYLSAINHLRSSS